MDEVGTAVIAISLVLIAVFVPTAFIPGITGQFYLQFAITIAVVDGDLGVQFADAVAGAGGAAVQAAPRRAAPPRFFLARFGRRARRRLQPRLRQARRMAMRRIVRLLVGSWIALARHARRLRRAHLRHRLHGADGAARLHPDARPGLCDRRRAAAGRRLAVAHRRGGAAGLRDHPEHAGRRRCRRLRRLLRRHLHQRQQCRRDLRRVRPVRGAARGRPVGATRSSARCSAACRASRRPSSSRCRRRRSAASAMPAASRCSCRSATAPTCGQILALAYEIAGKANQTPGLTGVFTTFSASSPQFFLEIDRDKARMLNVPIPNIFETLSINLGTSYVNDFNAFGRVYQVRAQADQAVPPRARRHPEAEGALGNRRAGAARHAGRDPRRHRPVAGPALQHVRLGAAAGQRRARRLDRRRRST